MEWYQKSITKRANASLGSRDERLIEALNDKYGDYDYKNDVRLLNKDLLERAVQGILPDSVGKKSVLIAGAGTGSEVSLFKGVEVTALDLSDRALARLKADYPEVHAVHGNIEELPFKDNAFNLYVSFRTIHSSNVNLERALEESVRVVKEGGILMYSISNGYLINGLVTQGMYNTKEESFSEEVVERYVEKIRLWMYTMNFDVVVIPLTSEIVIVARPMGDVLKSTKAVYENSKHVLINTEKLKEVCKTFHHGDMNHWLSASPFQIDSLTGQDKLNFLLTFNSLSFSYWGEPKWKVTYNGKEYDGSWALVTALERALDEGIPILDSHYRESMTRDDLTHILRGNVEVPLLDERLETLKETARIINEKYDCDAANILKKAQYDALKIVDRIVRDVTAFSDVGEYNGQPIYFYKKAQLFVSDVSTLFSGEEYGNIIHVNQLTALADYKIPQILRKLGILDYEPVLAKKIDSLTELPKGSEEEIEIRANTIWAVELMKRELQKNTPGISAIEINDHLWLLSQECKLDDRPYHRTRTTSY